MNLKRSSLVLTLPLLYLLSSCNSAKFSGSNGAKSKPIEAPGDKKADEPKPEEAKTEPIPVPAVAEDPKVIVPAVPVNPADKALVTNTCTRDVSKGMHLILLVDNSGSMTQTDCPNPIQTASGTQCQAETNREKAIIGLVDKLLEIRQKNIGDDEALSSISITNFTPALAGDGRYDTRVEGLSLSPEWRSSLQSALSFNRFPAGDTPYLNGVRAAKQALDRIDANFGQDGKERIIVFLTDGEPTDRDPTQVLSESQALKNRARWLSIMVNSGQSRETRWQSHSQVMSGYETSFGPQVGGTWRAARYASFNDYLAGLRQLSDGIHDRLVEVTQADQLASVIKSEVIQKSVTCQAN